MEERVARGIHTKLIENLIPSGEYIIMFQKFYGHSIILLGKFRPYFNVNSLIFCAQQLSIGASICGKKRYKSLPKTQLEINPNRRITRLFQQTFRATIEFFNDKFRKYFWVNSLTLRS